MFFLQACKSLILAGILLTMMETHLSSSSMAESIAVPLVKLENYELYEGKIAANIEVWNVIDTDISNLFLQLKCQSLSRDELKFYILFLSKNDHDFIKSAETYGITHHHIMERGFAFQEKRNIHLEIDVETNLALAACTGLSVIGYR